MEHLFLGYIIMSISQDVINVLYCYFRNRLDDSTCFYVPYKLMYGLFRSTFLFPRSYIISTCRVPWDQGTLKGYFYSAAMCLLCGPAFFIVNFSFLPFFMGIGAHYAQFRYYFRDLIREVNTYAGNGSVQYKKAKATLAEAVEFHNDVKE